MDDPRFIVEVVLQRPKGSIYGITNGPVFRSVMSQALRTYNVPPSKGTTGQAAAVRQVVRPLSKTAVHVNTSFCRVRWSTSTNGDPLVRAHCPRHCRCPGRAGFPRRVPAHGRRRSQNWVSSASRSASPWPEPRRPFTSPASPSTPGRWSAATCMWHCPAPHATAPTSPRTAIESGAVAVLTDDAGARLLALSPDIAVPVLVVDEPRGRGGPPVSADLPEPGRGRLRRRRSSASPAPTERPPPHTSSIPCCRRSGKKNRADRHHRDRGRRRSDSQPPDHAGIHRRPRPARPHARTGARCSVHGSVLARSVVPPRRRRGLRRRRVHQPHPGPPGPARHHGGVLPDQGGALHRRSAPAPPS